MTGKKGRALALELMDDLLDDEDQELDIESDLESLEGSEHLKSPSSRKDSGSGEISVSEDEDPSAEFDFSAVENSEETLDEGSRTLRLSSKPDEGSAPPSLPKEKTSQGPSEKTAIVHSRPDSHSGDIDDKVRASVGRFAGLGGGGRISPMDATLAQSENLRLAQQRILELEQEVERLRMENEQLAAAGETFRRRADEVATREQKLNQKLEDQTHQFQEEKQILLNSMEQKDRQLVVLKDKVSEMEARLSTNIQKIRVRERELENRLELVRMESSALVRNKDEIILDLKRQMDQLSLEIENYRVKSQELHQQITDKQETLKRTVKTLRLALALLEESDQIQEIMKKAK